MAPRASWAAILFSLMVVVACFGGHVAAEITRTIRLDDNTTATHSTYRIAALSDRGFDYFNRTMAPTFDEYLNNVVSKKFDGLVEFVTYPARFRDLLDEGKEDKFDFAFTNPAIFTCAEAELAMSSLVTLRRNELGEQLSQFGAVIFTRADRDDINGPIDIAGKTVAAVSFITFGGFQAQWGLLRDEGLDFLVDTKQIKFTDDENSVVNEVMEGKSDVGFVTSGVLEMQVFNGTLDLKQVKIIHAQSVITTDGDVFPFITSTEVLSPEWALAAMPRVNWQVQAAVVDALIAIQPDSKYALLGNYVGWQPPLSYTVTRALQVSLGVLFDDGLGSFSCVRTKSIIDAVVCPFGFVKKSVEEVANGCEMAGIICEDGYDCLCQPCEPACPSNARLLSTGSCQCESGYIDFGGACAPIIALVITILIPLAAFIVIIVVVAMRYQQNKVDLLWHIAPHELKFEDPVEVLGIGSYGVVVKAEYRGTAVAVKRVGPPEKHKGGRHASRATRDKQGVLSPAVLAGVRSMAGSTGSTKHSGTGSKRGRSKRSALQSARTKEKRAMDYILEVFDEAAEQGQAAGTKSHSIANSAMASGSRSRNLVSRLLHKSSKRATLARMRADFITEMRTLSKLRHPCVTTVMGAVMINGCEPMMIMEYMDLGSLYSILHNETMELDGETRYYLTIDVVSGCRFLHSSNPPLIHGDLKSLNVLVDSKFRAKVADFGLSESGNGKACGTPYWMAPEVLRGEPTTVASDVYSFAIILNEVFSRKDPYPVDADLENTLKEVIKRKRRPLVPPNCPENIAQLMREAWHPDPDRRPSFDELARRFGHIDPSNCRMDDGRKKGKDSNKVLEDVFPPHIAKALREGKKIEPEHHDCVTIFFSDIVGFTNISGTLAPEKVMNMLDRLYTKLDALADEMELFKVETIGDAYMAVTNLLKEQKDHAARIGRFAVAAIKAANTTLINEDEPDLGCVNIRVGFHAGPVVANVVGTKNPRYCLFGDTVNTASRMESNSEKNRIHMSEAAAELVSQQAPDMLLEPRKAMHIKGKGKMQTYFLIADDIDHASSSDTAGLMEAKRKKDRKANAEDDTETDSNDDEDDDDDKAANDDNSTDTKATTNPPAEEADKRAADGREQDVQSQRTQQVREVMRNGNIHRTITETMLMPEPSPEDAPSRRRSLTGSNGSAMGDRHVSINNVLEVMYAESVQSDDVDFGADRIKEVGDAVRAADAATSAANNSKQEATGSPSAAVSTLVDALAQGNVSPYESDEDDEDDYDGEDSSDIAEELPGAMPRMLRQDSLSRRIASNMESPIFNDGSNSNSNSGSGSGSGSGNDELDGFTHTPDIAHSPSEEGDTISSKRVLTDAHELRRRVSDGSGRKNTHQQVSVQPATPPKHKKALKSTRRKSTPRSSAPSSPTRSATKASGTRRSRSAGARKQPQVPPVREMELITDADDKQNEVLI
ncbi:TKL/DICTY4 protein kinase [Salpingoeca rosetta]|uniref:guanylate cyclase n=1 Tax=Salpingoeca rosetta (strain ATCC 50818 / BSB-021) TaxID=946362 RepID=F2TVM8_SALR5|nr:TKL/DICTY4 protein kinase [Salpingoeca rosetta]EGD72124.1 TKL/DICTY4 protein kinase [Salpingoeca rosetta]|eukprot:XP_004998696.1 TKL/DICTY4 protein kinase [Salpingoeca rosetta]